MYRVYVGNVDSEVTEEVLVDVLTQKGIIANGLVLKRGYAFIDCPDSAAFNLTIEKLNGYNLFGAVLQAEPSAIAKRMRSSSVEIWNLAGHLTRDCVLELLSSYGQVQRLELELIADDDAQDDSSFKAAVIFDNWQSAQLAFDNLDSAEYEGHILKVQIVTEASVQKSPTSESAPPVANHRPILSIPLRILVPSDFIGAIIGRKGQTIRSITTQSKARIDVHGRESSGMLDKMISISGPLENCSDACRQIVTIMQREAVNTNRGDVTLRMLIDDRYCGRIIGRDGKTVKKIREETGTRISISNVQEMASLYPDRVVAIRGDVDNMSKAETAISAKLRECYERDTASAVRPVGLATNISPVPVHATSFHLASRVSEQEATFRCADRDDTAHGGVSKGPEGGGVVDARVTSPPSRLTSNVRITCRIGIPNYAVGAIIGTAGGNIKRIIRDSNAFVTVEPRQDDQSPSEERFVTIKGSSDACWRASYFIFEKMKLEGFAGPDGDVRLRTLFTIPQSAAGRVVGRGGKNVREIQRATGALITLSSATYVDMSPTVGEAQAETVDAADQSCHETVPEMTDGPGEVTVEVYGNFVAIQGAHNRIRSTVYKTPSPWQTNTQGSAHLSNDDI